MNNSDIEQYLENAEKATVEFAKYSQFKVNKIIKEVYLTGFRNRVLLAKMAVAETGIGKWEDKVTKNILATKYIYEDIKHLKTVGVIFEDNNLGIIKIAKPVGTILAIVPSTNPSSTVMFKILIALKTRNPIIISAPTRAKNVCNYTAELLYKSALKAGAPKNCIQWIKNPSREKTEKVMRDKRLGLILATGGKNLVNLAYSSGTPALGVGPGNVPVLIENSFNIELAIKKIIHSKTFDNGTICASEQAIVIEKPNMKKAIEALEKYGAYIVPNREIKALEEVVYNRELEIMSSDIVGKTANFIAKKAKLNVPNNISLLVAKQTNVGKEYPLSSEILAPVIAIYEANDFEHALKICLDINNYGGKGHTASIFSNDKNKIMRYSMLINTSRIIINSPSAQGAVGGLYNNLTPSLTLGCGTDGRNITTDNITAKHLLNIQRVAKPKKIRKPSKEKRIINKKRLSAIFS